MRRPSMSAAAIRSSRSAANACATCSHAAARSISIRVRSPGQCAQSHYFKSSIVLIPTGDDAFEIVLRRSFADYFVRIMLDAVAPLAS